jgi:murein DD-endopeptidase MepM/ murein hydrolase activator NlpD
MTHVSRRRRPLPRVLALVLLSSLLTFLAVAPSVSAAAATTWVWPLDPQPAVLTGFDPPDERWGAGHRGVDLAGYPGQPVRSAGAGVVSFAGMLGGRGVVAVTHGALRTTYLPVDAEVTVGRRVEAGEVLGTLAVIGGHCLPRICLHWGLLQGSTYLNPLSLVGAGPIRLLPTSAPSVLRGLFMPGPVVGPMVAAFPVGSTAPPDQARGWARP